MEKISAGRCRGFTITEMAMTLAIAAIALTIGVPAMRDLGSSQRVRSAAHSLYTDLTFARAEAIKRNASIQLVRESTAWTGGWAVRSGADSLRSQTAIAGVSYAGTTVPSVTFNPDGRVTLGAEVSFNFAAPDGGAVSMRCVVITPSGRPAVLTDSNRNGNCHDG